MLADTTFGQVLPWVMFGAIAAFGLRWPLRRLSLHGFARHGGRQMLLNRIHRNRDLLEVRDRAGCTPLIAAAEGGRVGTLEALLEEGADVHATTNDGRTALMSAAAIDDQAALRWLLRYGAKVDAVDHLGRSALHHAAERSAKRAAATLIFASASTTIVDARGRTAEQIARTNQFLQLADLLAGTLALDEELLRRLDVKPLNFLSDLEAQAIAATPMSVEPGSRHASVGDDEHEGDRDDSPDAELVEELGYLAPTTDELRALRALGRPVGERAVEWARAERADGHDSPALHRLAAATPPFAEDVVAALVDQALAERHVPACEHSAHAARLLTTAWTQYTIDEELDWWVVLPGLRRIFHELHRSPPELHEFARLADAADWLDGGGMGACRDWPGATRENMEQIVDGRFRAWLQVHPPAASV